MSADEFIRNQREMFHDRKFAAALEGIGEEAAAGDGGGGGLGDLGDLGGDSGGGDGLGDLDLGGDEPAAEPASGGDDDSPLLAEPPAKRDDDAKPRGPYKRHQSSYDKGGRTKNYKNIATGGEVPGSTPRTIHQGYRGPGSLYTLAKGMVEESQQTENLEEQKLFTISNDVKKLLESLTNREDEHETQ